MAHDKVPLGHPPIRTWELGEINATRYDRVVAAPSDETMHAMWLVWSILFAFIAVYVGTVFLAILLNKHTRRSPFNCYLLYLMFPDLVYSASCVFTCALNMIAGHFYSPAACQWQSFYLMWGCASNCYLNAVVAWQMRTLLWSSHKRLRYYPPTRRTVTIHALIVYAYSAFVASWAALAELPAFSWLPHRTQAQVGIVCVPLEYNRQSTLFFWLVFCPALMGIPLVVVGCVVWDVLYHDLLPSRGKRRALGIYFFRIAVAFVVMWTPTILYFFVLGGIVSPWGVWVSGAWGHLQGCVSTTVSLWKPDIHRAVKEFLCCTKAEDAVPGSSYSFMRRRSGSSLSAFFRRSLKPSSRSHERAEAFVVPSAIYGSGNPPPSSSQLSDPSPFSEQKVSEASAGPCSPSRNTRSCSSGGAASATDYYDDLPVQSEITFQFLDETLPGIHEDEEEGKNEHKDDNDHENNHEEERGGCIQTVGSSGTGANEDHCKSVELAVQSHDDDDDDDDGDGGEEKSEQDEDSNCNGTTV